MTEEKPSFNNKLIMIIFGLSEMSTLIYEMIWIKSLSLVFRTTTYTVLIIIIGFLSVYIGIPFIV